MVSYPWYDPNIFNQADIGNAYQAMIVDPKSRSSTGQSSRAILGLGVQGRDTAGIPKRRPFLRQDHRLRRRDLLRRPRIPLPYPKARAWTAGFAGGPRPILRRVLLDSEPGSLGIERIVSYATEFGFGAMTENRSAREDRRLRPDAPWKERRSMKSGWAATRSIWPSARATPW
jgi:penicillin-binding protein 2